MAFAMVRKTGINVATEGSFYNSHAMYRLGSLREENMEKSICRCAASRYRSGMESVDQNSEVFNTILAALPVAETRAESRRNMEDCGGMTGLEFEALRLKIIVK